MGRARDKPNGRYSGDAKAKSHRYIDYNISDIGALETKPSIVVISDRTA
jgi:hypothetical protein